MRKAREKNVACSESPMMKNFEKLTKKKKSTHDSLGKKQTNNQNFSVKRKGDRSVF